MKKTILGLAALVLVTFTYAQSSDAQKGKHHRMEQRGEKSFKALNLTEAQKQQVKTINEDFHKQMQALNSKENITVQEQRTQRETLTKAHKSAIDAVLTTEQKQQLAQEKAENLKDRADQADERLDKMKEKLNLSDAQVATIKSKQQKTHEKIEAIRKNENMDEAAKKQQLMALRNEMKTNIDEVLTPEQKTKMEAFRKDNHEKMKPSKGRRMHNDNVK